MKASCSFYLTPAHTKYSERRIILSGEMHGLLRHLCPVQEKCMDFQEIHPRVAYDLAHVCISWSVHTNKWRTTHNALCGYYKFSFRIFISVYLNFSEYKQYEISGFLIEINFIAILNTILFNIFTLPVKRYFAMNTLVTWLKFVSRIARRASPFITGFLFRIRTQVTALGLRTSSFTWVLMRKKKPVISNTGRFFCFNST